MRSAASLPPVIAKARTRLVVTAPFYGSIALGLAWQEESRVPTMATDGSTIFFNSTWCETIGVEKTAGVTAHEVLHVVGKHHLRMHGRDPRLWNIAADLVINRVLTSGGFALPDDLLHDHRGEFAGLPVETVYARLQQRAESGAGEGGQPAPTWGEVLPATDTNGRPLPAAVRAVAEAEIDVRVRHAVAAAKRAGKLPRDLGLMIEATTGRTDWRDRFRRLVDGLVRDGISWARPNRRFLPHGLYLPSPARTGVGSVAVVLDTSGSITEAELGLYTGEVIGLLEELQPDELVLVQCDSEVRSTLTLTDRDSFERIEVEGRGGTLFQPAFDWVAEEAPQVRCIVYMTDLMSCDRPRDPGIPVIWLTPTLGRAMPFGEIISVTPER